jgi:hypothetical protein
MRTCWSCGREIIFRYVGGRLTPIHVDGEGWCNGGYSSNQFVAEEKKSFEFKNTCWQTLCPNCQQPVFFIRHNGGSLWVDELGWPWNKHPCMNQQTDPPWYKYFTKSQLGSADEKLFFGVVVEAKWFSKNITRPSRIILAVDGGVQGRIVLSTEATTTAEYLLNKLVIVDISKMKIAISTHDIKPIYELGINPEVIGLTVTWASKK